MTPLQKAIDRAGSQAKLAALIGKRQSHVSMWVKRGRVPADMCAPIEQAVDGAVTRHDLRPDIFGERAA